MTQELKPCPFCNAVGGDSEETEVWLFDNTDYESENCFPMFMVMCNNCESTSGNKATEEEAITAWNRRAEPVVSKMENTGGGKNDD